MHSHTAFQEHARTAKSVFFVGAVRSLAIFCGVVTSHLEFWRGRLKAQQPPNESKRRERRIEIEIVEYTVDTGMVGWGRRGGWGRVYEGVESTQTERKKDTN